MSAPMIKDLEARDGIALQAELNAPIEDVWDFLRDPRHHAEIDGSDMIRAAADADPIERVGQVFVMEMLWTDGTTQYRTENHVTRYDIEHRLEWLVADEGQDPQGWSWGWTLSTAPDDSTLAVCFCDWSQTSPEVREQKGFPVVDAGRIEATLRNLAEALG